jgi:hypothetical protein
MGDAEINHLRNALDDLALDHHSVPADMRPDLFKDLHVWDGARAYTGFAAYRRVARRQPLLWPLLPFLYLPPIPQLGRRIYRLVADSRQCRVGLQPKPVSPPAPARAWPVVAVAVPLLTAIVIAGAARQLDGWPVAHYPDFAYVPGDRTEVIRFEVGTQRERATIRASKVLPALKPEQLGGLTRTLAHEADPARRERAFADLAASISMSLDGAYSDLWIRLETVATNPDEDGRVITSERMAHLNLQRR